MPTLTIAQALEMAIAHHQSGRLAEAEAIYRQILAQQPRYPDALHLLGLIAAAGGRLEVAEQLIRQAIAAAPAMPNYPNNLGKLFRQAGRMAEALDLLRCAVQLAPNWAEGWFDLGACLETAGDASDAFDAYRRVLQLDPAHVRALNQVGLIWRARENFAEAERCLRQALALQPDAWAIRGNLGGTLELLGRYTEAIEHYREALKAAPDHFMLHFNMGVSLAALGRLPEAETAYKQSIAFKGDYPPAHNNLGTTLKSLGKFDEAIAVYERALALQPDLSQAHSNLASILASRAQHGPALEHNRRAVEVRPDHALTHSNLCYLTLFLHAYDTPAMAWELKAWNEKFGAPLRDVRRPHVNSRAPERRLRIGYVSPDFRDHVIARNMIPAFRHRDRSACEVFCYSNLTLQDDTTAEFRRLADHWRDIWGVEDARLAEQIRADGIDILVDLALHMAGNRLPLFAHKPAPVQATFAGYPGSTGLETMDYRITDGFLEPPEMEGAWVEKSVRLRSFWCYDPQGVSVPVNPLPAAAGGSVTFGCLNHFCKVNDGVLDVWSQALAAVPGSRLALLTAEGSHRQRTTDYLAQRGVAPERIVFFTFRPRPDYLALYHQIDIGLDTLPYNGHTTSLDALWMGVPVVTLVGRTEAGRAGLSQLSNLGLPELITRTPAEYVQTVAALAQDLGRLRDYRATLRGRMEKSILMDGPAFARGLDAAYRAMWRRWCASAS